jgi:hypothetical protein
MFLLKPLTPRPPLPEAGRGGEKCSSFTVAAGIGMRSRSDLWIKIMAYAKLLLANDRRGDDRLGRRQWRSTNRFLRIRTG